MAVAFQEVLKQIDLECFTELITAVRVWNDLDDAAQEFVCASSIADALVRDHIEV